MKRIFIFFVILLLAVSLASAAVAVKTANYNVTLADNAATIVFNSASNLSAVLPSLSSTDVGFWLTITKAGAGNVTLALPAADYVADSGVGQYIRNTTAAETYATITLMYVSANHWKALSGFGTWSTDVSTFDFSTTLTKQLLQGSYAESLAAGSTDEYAGSLRLTPSYVGDGVIATVAVHTAGTGYTVADVLTVASGTAGTVTVASISGGQPTGPVASVTVTTGGLGYTPTAGLATTGGTGTGCKITVSTITTRTVTRHNYIDAKNLSVSYGAAVTDAVLFRFDANAGTHQAVDSAAGFATAGWIKANLNGTLAYIPMMTATSAVGSPTVPTLILKGTGSYNTTFQAGAASASKTYTLPLTDGTTGQALVTDGSAILSWSTTTPSLLSFSSTATGLSYSNTTGVFSLTAGYVIPTTTEETKWTASDITAGTGTGLTVNSAGNAVRQVYKVTVDYTGFSAAALTADHTIATLPAKTKLVAVYCDTTVPYTGGSVATATMMIGKTAGAAEYIAVHDVKSAATIKGLADADMGTELTRAAAIQGGAVVNWTTTTTVVARITTTSANTSALTAGSTTFYLITERY
jgi:hypothetical protein